MEILKSFTLQVGDGGEFVERGVSFGLVLAGEFGDLVVGLSGAFSPSSVGLIGEPFHFVPILFAHGSPNLCGYLPRLFGQTGMHGH